MPVSNYVYAPHYTDGSYIRLCQVGSDMTKVKKSKGFPRQYKLEKDLLSIVWDSKHKALSKAKSKSVP